jgi:hypothetical protein
MVVPMLKPITLLFAVSLVLAPTLQSQEGSILEWGSVHYPRLLGNDYAKVVCGINHSHALRLDGTIEGWGSSSSSQVANTPTEAGHLQVAAGSEHSLALRADGSIVSWGSNLKGAVSLTPSGTGYQDIAGGGFHSVAIRADGSLAGWGWNLYSQCSGPAGNDYVKVGAGFFHSIALKADGSLVAWGRDSYGSVSGVPAGTGFVDITVGHDHQLALKADGSIVGWGYDINGEVSNIPPGNDFVAVAAGDHFSMALKSDGTLVSWGLDEYNIISDTPAGNDIIAIGAYGIRALAVATRIGHPILRVEQLMEGETASLEVSSCEPGNMVLLAASLNGGGPISTAYGPVFLTRPLRLFSPMFTDSSGTANVDFPLPQRSDGIKIWFHGADVTRGFLTNSFAEFIGENPAPWVRSVSPKEAETQTVVGLALEGDRFFPGAVIELVGATHTVQASSFWFVSSELIGGSFDLVGAPVGFYNVQVTNPTGHSGALVDGFEVLPAAP